MVGAFALVDQYVARTLSVVIGSLAMLGGAFTLWMSVHRKAPSTALKGLGGLVAGVLLALWGLRLIPDLFSVPWGPYLVGVSLSLIALGVLVGSARSRAENQAPGTWRRGLCSAAGGVLICAGMLAVCLMAPPRYESVAVLAAAFLFVLGVSLVRRRRGRRDLSGRRQPETQRKPQSRG